VSANTAYEGTRVDDETLARSFRRFLHRVHVGMSLFSIPNKRRGRVTDCVHAEACAAVLGHAVSRAQEWARHGIQASRLARADCEQLLHLFDAVRDLPITEQRVRFCGHVRVCSCLARYDAEWGPTSDYALRARACGIQHVSLLQVYEDAFGTAAKSVLPEQ
jgi:hypothetical protein